MKTMLLGLVFALTGVGLVQGVLAASPNADLLKAKREAEAKGYIFETSHDEIVAKAKKEGKLRVMTTLEVDVVKAAAGSV
jgi:hypothetical protein